MDLYIYYKVNPLNAVNLRQKILALQESLSKDWQVKSSLQRRTETHQSSDILQTWMEVYSAIPEGFLIALQTACDRSDVQTLIEGERHTEFFTDVALCA